MADLANQGETALPVNVEVARYEVSCLPRGHREYRHYKINVERSRDGWLVHDGYMRLTENGAWVEPNGIGPLHEEAVALRLAREAAPHLTCNAHTVAEALSEGDDRG